MPRPSKKAEIFPKIPAGPFSAGEKILSTFLFILLGLGAALLKAAPLPAQEDEFPFSQDDLSALAATAEAEGPDSPLSSWLTDDYSSFEGVGWVSIDGQQRVSELNLINMNLEGALEIDSLPHLKRLELYGNRLEALKITNCPKLEKIAAKDNELAAFYTGCQTELKNLDLAENRLTEISLENAPNLTNLDLSQNPIPDIDPSPLSRLEFFYAEDSPSPFIDLSRNPMLLAFRHTGPKVTRADLTSNPKLLALDLSEAQIHHLDLRQNPRLSRLSLVRCPLADLDLSKNLNLEKLDISGANLKHINIPSPKLLSLALWDTDIDSLDLSRHQELVELDVAYSKLENLDLSQNLIINKLVVSGTPLADFSLIAFPSLTGPKTIKSLGLDLGQYQTFDFIILPGLKELFIFDKSEAKGNFKANLTLNSAAIQSLAFDCDGVESLDLSAFKNLRSLSVLKSRLKEIILPENQNPFKGQAILEENRLPLSQLLPFSDPKYFAVIGDQEKLFFERLPGQRQGDTFTFDLARQLETEWELDGVATDFQFIDANTSDVTTNCRLFPNGTIKCRPGQYRLQMQNPLILNTHNTPATAATGVLSAE